MWVISNRSSKTDKKFGTQKLGCTVLPEQCQENGKFGIFFLIQDLISEMSNIDHAKLENRQIFFHGDIDDCSSVAFILSSSLDRPKMCYMSSLVFTLTSWHH